MIPVTGHQTDRHHPGAFGRVRSGRIYDRHHRTTLQTVCFNHVYIGDNFGHQRPNA